MNIFWKINSSRCFIFSSIQRVSHFAVLLVWAQMWQSFCSLNVNFKAFLNSQTRFSINVNLVIIQNIVSSTVFSFNSMSKSQILLQHINLICFTMNVGWPMQYQTSMSCILHKLKHSEYIVKILLSTSSGFRGGSFKFKKSNFKACSHSSLIYANVFST